MKIHLIRHGKTYANEKRLYCGKTDLPFSENGIREIVDLKEQGIYPKGVDLFFCSGLIRTVQTIEFIYGPAHYEVVSSLVEYNFGDFEMKSFEELKNRPGYQAWISDDLGEVSCPNGESKQQFTKRVLDGFEQLIKKSPTSGEVLLVSHGGVIVSIMEHFFPNTKNFYEWQPKPARGYSLGFNSSGGCKYEKI